MIDGYTASGVNVIRNLLLFRTLEEERKRRKDYNYTDECL